MQENEVLRLVPEIYGEVPDIEEAMILISGKRFNEVAVVTAVELRDLVTALVVPKKLSLSALRDFIEAQLIYKGFRQHLDFGRERAVWNETTHAQISSIRLVEGILWEECALEGIVGDVI